MSNYNDNLLDEIIKKELETNIEITEQDKAEVWNKIEGEIFNTKGKKRKGFKSQYRYFISSAAVIAVTVLGIQTQPGAAFVDKIKTMFEHEKEVSFVMEGDTQNEVMTMKANTLPAPNDKAIQNEDVPLSEFVIYIDEERYQMSEVNGINVITTKTPLDSKYPEVSMEISQIAKMKPTDIAKELQTDLKNTFETVSELEQVKNPIDAITMRGISGSEWNSPITKHYVFSNGKGGSFVVTQKYFLEAAEGHALRFDAMLKEFHIVEE